MGDECAFLVDTLRKFPHHVMIHPNPRLQARYVQHVDGKVASMYNRVHENIS